MTRTITIDPVTRIEGHAKITIYLDDNEHVADARFHVTEFRGFEKFCEGRSFAEMPGITARICGICPVSHLLVWLTAEPGLDGPQSVRASVGGNGALRTSSCRCSADLGSKNPISF